MENILDAFATVYASTLARPELVEQIQAVKDALYRRSYIEAFGSTANLLAYVVRWSPSRALAYSHIFETKPAIKEALTENSRVLCIGGGAGAEIAALSMFPVKVTTIDQGDWQQVVDPLAQALGVETTMIHGDALTTPIDYAQFDMISVLFTTNELFAQSKALAVKFLQSLNNCKKGTVFVVLESAGSYSEITIGNKKFPVHFIVHHTMTAGNSWSLVEETDSEWWRLPSELISRYPQKLENMRYFLRVYKKL